MALLCRSAGCRLGLVTDGDLLRFVWAPPNSSTGQATWRASLFSSERAHVESLWTIFHARRFFAVGPEQQPEALLERSEAAEEEVTDTLGTQVRRAVELLVAALDRANRDAGGKVLAGVDPTELYEAAVTVMMRLVFLLTAEEQGFLPLNNKVYGDDYAISTLRAQLQEAERRGRERLEGTASAWHRILAVSRAVFGGVTHELLTIVPYGGRLFDPDRFPFLEGRPKRQTQWWAESSNPPAVDDLTILEIMRSLQVLRISGEDTRHLSFRNIKVEQIGHVYERLLDHSAVRADRTVLGLIGKEGDEPEVALADVEGAAMKGRSQVLAFLEGSTKLSAGAIDKALDADFETQPLLALRTACGGDSGLTERIKPYLGLLRLDLRGFPLVFPKGTYYVTLTGSRRSTGTAYTTRELAEEIAEHTLAPICFRPGPAETTDRSQWRVRPSSEILDLKVCDPAVGSGAILVAACRYLANRLIDAWLAEGVLEADQLATAGDDPERVDHRVRARRLVAERCCYGVDRNPVAVEMARMSFWLTTIALDRPFTFLDHNLRSGDSLLGLTSLDQLRVLHLNPDVPLQHHLPIGVDAKGSWTILGPLINEAMALRNEIEQTPSDVLRDIVVKEALSVRSTEMMRAANAIADLIVGCGLVTAASAGHDEALTRCIRENASPLRAVLNALGGPSQNLAISELATHAQQLLDGELPDGASHRRPLHWPLEFPEVVSSTTRGFDAFLGNPPFMGGRLIGRALGDNYRDLLASSRGGRVGSSDLCTYFLLRTYELLPPGGSIGFITTNSIADTGNRAVALEPLVSQGMSIYSVATNIRWPGRESVVVNILHMAKRPWHGSRTLNGRTVDWISDKLDTNRDIPRPAKLLDMVPRKSQGVDILGEGFVIDELTMARLIELDPRNSEVISGYFNGDDLNNLPRIEPYRWLIDFRDMDYEAASVYAGPFDLVTELVKPYRDGLTGQIHEKSFWKFWDKRPMLQMERRRRSAFMACAAVSKYVSFQFVPSRHVYNKKVKLFFFDTHAYMALFQSSVHDHWARYWSGYLGASGINYSTSAAFDTFPMPNVTTRKWNELETLGRDYDRLRNDTRSRETLGLTEVYNLFHNGNEHGGAISQLRDLHVAIDQVVIEAYGWDDINVVHDFYPDRQVAKFGMSDEVSLQILERLSALNSERCQLEQLPLASGSRTRNKGLAKKLITGRAPIAGVSGGEGS